MYESAYLVHVSGGVVEDSKHGYDAIACAVGPSDVGVTGSDVVDRQPNAT